MTWFLIGYYCPKPFPEMIGYYLGHVTDTQYWDFWAGYDAARGA